MKPDHSAGKSTRPVRLGILGAGLRTRALLKLFLAQAGPRVRISTVYDPDPAAVAALGQMAPEVTVCRTENTVIESSDWVFIGSYNALHARQAIAALNAGRHVFCEKPLATTLDDCLAVGDAVRRSGCTFFFGLVLRYTPVCRKTKELLDGGAVGKMISFEFNETLNFSHGGFIFGNWRRLPALAGSHILEKCCHDLDLSNWMTQSRPARVASFGGRDFFVPGNAHHKDRIGPDARGHKAYYSYIEPEFHSVDPFTGGGKIMDNQVAILEYENGVRATFHANCNAGLPERRFYICGTEGSLRADIYTGKIEWAPIGHDRKTEVWDMSSRGSHAGGDNVIVGELLECMLDPGRKPAAGVLEGIDSAAVALAIDQARLRGRVIEMDEIWKKRDALRLQHVPRMPQQETCAASI